MKGADSKTPASGEPVGILISGFSRAPKATLFSAYVWAPAPPKSDDSEPKAA